MDIKWDTPLRDGQKDHPVVYSTFVDLPKDVFFPDNLSLKLIFKTDGYKLQTWGRSKDSDGKTILTNDPHWIAVRKSTPLHFDPKYPRYSHHLKVRVDDGIYVRGKAKKELKLERGTFYILDAHSPHQVFQKKDTAVWNVAVSIDSHTILDAKETINKCIEYARTAPFYNK